MRRTRITFVAILAFLVGPTLASADSIILDPSFIGDVADGDIITFDIVMDFSDVGGTLGGGFDVMWDNSALGFAGFFNNDIGDFANLDPVFSPGLLESWAFASFTGLFGPLAVGSVSFEILTALGADTFVTLGPTAGIGGPFVSAQDFISILEPDFGGGEVQRPPVVSVPEPGTLTLFGLGLAAFGFTRRRK